MLELGAGTGLAGLAAAAAGAHVLLTDVPSIVTDALEPNIARNANPARGLVLGEGDSGARDPGGWEDATAVGLGTATATPLDWTVPLAEQLVPSRDPRRAELVLAAECVWLEELVEPFVKHTFGQPIDLHSF